MEEPESTGPGMNIAPVVYLTFIVEGDQILFVLKMGIAGFLGQLLRLGATALT